MGVLKEAVGQRKFNSSNRRLFRELAYTAIRFWCACYGRRRQELSVIVLTCRALANSVGITNAGWLHGCTCCPPHLHCHLTGSQALDRRNTPAAAPATAATS